MQTIGRRGNLGIGIEATPGTTVAMTAFVPFLACNMQGMHTPIANNSARGIRDDQLGSVTGKQWGEGSIEVILDAETTPSFIHLFMGSYTTAAGILHTMSKTATCEPLTATLYVDRKNDVLKFPNAVVDTLEINFADDVAKLTANFFSKFPIEENAETPTYGNLDILTWRNASVTVNNAGTTTEYKVREFNLEVKNNAEMIFAPNSNNLDRVVLKDFSAAGSLVVDFTNTANLLYQKDLTKLNLTVELQQGATGLLIINMPQVMIEKDDLATPIDDISKETLNFVAEYDGTSTIVFTATNDVLSFVGA